jgi:tRNA (mo5U34)-methyltransferase
VTPSALRSAHPAARPPREELVARVRAAGWWYQRIDLGEGVFTTEDPQYHELVWQRIAPAFPERLGGASVLDVGCNAGYFAIELKRRGAGRVLGVEPVPLHFEQAILCRDALGLDIQYVRLDAHEVARLGSRFDVVVFTGVLYHLRNPLLVLEQVGRLCRDVVVVETECIVDDERNVVYARQGPQGAVTVAACRRGFMKFVEGGELNDDGSNWWIPDTECVLGMLRAAGFTRFSTPIYPTEGRLLVLATRAETSLADVTAVR